MAQAARHVVGQPVPAAHRLRPAAVLCLLLLTVVSAAEQQEGARRVTWQDVAPVQARLAAHGFTAGNFTTRIEQLAADNARRVRQGDLDHLVFYLLQSTHFTTRPALEPALSAKALVDSLDAPARAAFLDDPDTARGRVSGAVRARADALLRAMTSPGADVRLAYFARLLAEAAPAAHEREAVLVSEYLRVMRFVHEKEFGAGRSDAAAAASLYRTRGLSTDTAVEAGFIVAQGLGVLRALEPARRVRRVLIVGAGLDLAPRTALLEAAPPQSYQPWAVLDALVGLGLSRLDDIEVVAADINPRVVDHLRTMHAVPPALALLTGVGDEGPVGLAEGYREYFAALGRSIGRVEEAPPHRGHLHTRLHVSPEAARVLRPVQLDVVTERLTGAAFDLVVATNVFPYFDDDALTLAVSNIAGMLAPDGLLLHNEVRPALHEIAAALGLPASHSRHAVIATVKGAPPLGDSVWLHGRRDATRR
jgi:hypothetical protein